MNNRSFYGKTATLLFIAAFIFITNAYSLPVGSKNTLRLSHQFATQEARGRWGDIFDSMLGYMSGLRLRPTLNKEDRVGRGFVRAVEKKVLRLESRGVPGKWGSVSYFTGLAGITNTIMNILETKGNKRPHAVVFEPLYGCSSNFIAELDKVADVERIYSIDDLENVLRDDTALVYFETPTNPNRKIVEITSQ